MEVYEEKIFTSDDFCTLCLPERKEKRLPPNIKVTLPEATSALSLLVRVCPECDGTPPILGQTTKEAKEENDTL